MYNSTTDVPSYLTVGIRKYSAPYRSDRGKGRFCAGRLAAGHRGRTNSVVLYIIAIVKLAGAKMVKGSGYARTMYNVHYARVCIYNIINVVLTTAPQTLTPPPTVRYRPRYYHSNKQQSCARQSKTDFRVRLPLQTVLYRPYNVS